MKELSRDDELKLLGLKMLALQHNRALNDIQQAVVGIVGEKDEFGHAGDYVWSDHDNVTPQQLWERTAADRDEAPADA